MSTYCCVLDSNRLRSPICLAKKWLSSQIWAHSSLVKKTDLKFEAFLSPIKLLGISEDLTEQFLNPRSSLHPQRGVIGLIMHIVISFLLFYIRILMGSNKFESHFRRISCRANLVNPGLFEILQLKNIFFAYTIPESGKRSLQGKIGFIRTYPGNRDFLQLICIGISRIKVDIVISRCSIKEKLLWG